MGPRYITIDGNRYEIKTMSELPGGKIELILKDLKTGSLLDRVIPLEEWVNLRESISTQALTFDGDPYRARLAAQAIYYKFIEQFDPALAMGSANIEPLPFQIEAVYKYILPMADDKIRFLLADDPGAGKTIMAGLVIKELILRGLARRILIVVPSHLKLQWYREMSEKFGLHFEIVDGAALKSGGNPFLKFNRIITSMDFAKQDKVRELLDKCDGEYMWDLVIIDEAHKMSAVTRGKKKKKTKYTKRYKLGQLLSERTEHMLLLTATPHSGNRSKFANLLRLLYPNMSDQALIEMAQSKDNPIMIRRLKEHLKGFDGKPLFMPRHVITKPFNLSSEEYKLYLELTNYISDIWGRATNLGEPERRSITFALTILQRRFASSLEALKSSLERRKAKLISLHESWQEDLPSEDLWELEEEEEDPERVEEKYLHLTSYAREELNVEIAEIDKLIKKTEELIQSGESTKWKALKEAISEALAVAESKGMPKKILIFTEYTDTLRALEKKLTEEGYHVVTIHGGMSLEERKRAETEFKYRADIMIATDAAGEGVNLQFASLMINYDIPWNPNRLEQRMGRIHRYGQRYEVFIYNMVAGNTREGRVLKSLLDKLNTIRRELGRDRVFDVIGEIIEEEEWRKIIRETVLGIRSHEDYMKEVDSVIDREAIEELILKLKEHSLVLEETDIKFALEHKRISEEARLTPEYVEEFITGVWNTLHKDSIKYISSKGFWRLMRIPYEIQYILESEEFRKQHGIYTAKASDIPYVKFGYDPTEEERESDTHIERIVPGHPLFEATVWYVEQKFMDDLLRGTTMFYPGRNIAGILWLYEGKISNAAGETVRRELITLLQHPDGSVEWIHPMVIWDLVPKRWASVSYRPEPTLTLSKAYELMEKRREDVKPKVKRRVEILNKSLASLYLKLAELKDAQQNIHRRKKIDIHAQELAEKIQKVNRLIVETPKFLGAIALIPDDEDLMSSDEEIEKIGMQIVMEYERRHGRHPEDVSKKNLGYDILSTYTDPSGKIHHRYIEVKARKGMGSVVLTTNEWVHARRKGKDYWLYIVANAATQPQLYLINDPASKLEPKRDIRYIIPADQWKSVAERG